MGMKPEPSTVVPCSTRHNEWKQALRATQETAERILQLATCQPGDLNVEDARDSNGMVVFQFPLGKTSTPFGAAANRQNTWQLNSGDVISGMSGFAFASVVSNANTAFESHFSQTNRTQRSAAAALSCCVASATTGESGNSLSNDFHV
jgi:hypothetical protein